MFIQSVSFVSSEIHTGRELNTVNQDGENECMFGTMTFLQSVERRQYLYHVQLKQKCSEVGGIIKGLTEMRKLDIVWKRNLGEMSMLQTIQLLR